MTAALEARMAKGRGRREPVRREDRIDPTPETVAKLIPDALRQFDQGQQRIARLIARAYVLLNGHSTAGANGFEMRSRGRTEMTNEDAALVSRYLEWRRLLDSQDIMAGAVLAVIVENWQAHNADALYRQPPGGVKRWVEDAVEVWRKMRREGEGEQNAA